MSPVSSRSASGAATGSGPATPGHEPRPRGPRPGGPDTRETVLAAARSEFATHGYDAATIRAIAGAAGVDPALVHHYFGTKSKLFTAALEFPFDPEDLFAQVLSGGIDGAGERLLRAVFAAWENPGSLAPMLAIIRTATTSDAGAAMLREFLDRNVLQRIAAGLSPDRARLRAALVASQMAGLMIARYVVCLPALATAPVEAIIAAVAPNVQHYLSGDLGRPVMS